MECLLVLRIQALQNFPFPNCISLVGHDEYISAGYKDRSAIVDAKHGSKLIAMGNALNYVIVVSGQIVGTWRRALKENGCDRDKSFRPLTQTEHRAVTSAADQYGRFVGLAVKLRNSAA
jgi:hypothetical protein